MFSPPTSFLPFPSPAQAKHEVARGEGVARKNGALVRCEQARHANPLVDRLRPNQIVPQLLCVPAACLRLVAHTREPLLNNS